MVDLAWKDYIDDIDNHKSHSEQHRAMESTRHREKERKRKRKEKECVRERDRERDPPEPTLTAPQRS